LWLRGKYNGERGRRSAVGFALFAFERLALTSYYTCSSTSPKKYVFINRDNSLFVAKKIDRTAFM
jgi:hypothetical protein